MTDDNTVVWQPQPKQAIALKCPAYELFYGGARGGGKSDFLLADYAKGVEQYGQHWHGIIFRRSLPELEELLKRSWELYPPLGGHFAEGRKTWEFPNGANLKFRYLDRDSDVHHYQGHQYTWIGFDELTNWATDYCYIYMHSCARSAEGVPVRVRASGNPGSVGHVWVKQRFVDVNPAMKPFRDPDTGLFRVFIPARLEDNLKLQENDPEYEGRLKMQPEHLYRAYRFGDWDIFAGQVFDEFRRDVHVIKPIKLEPSWLRFCSMDWGYAKPFSIGWWAVTGDGRMIRYREMYGCEEGKHNLGVKRPAIEVAREAWETSVAEGCTEMVADPACWAKIGTAQQSEPESIAEIFASVGWTMTKGINDRVSGLQRMHDMMKVVAHDGLPLLLVFDTCGAFIRTIPQLVVDEKNPEDVDTKGEDHVYDDSRYAVMSRQAKILQPEPKKLEAYTQTRRRYKAYDPFEN